MIIKCVNYNIVNAVINNISIAYQIAVLLNTNNNLKKKHTSTTILNNRVLYLIELFGDTVIGCVGLMSVGHKDKIMHLSVLNAAQRNGIGHKLLKIAIDTSSKGEIYMQVRNDNTKSLNLAYMNGFEVVSCIKKFDYSLFNLYLTRV